MSTGKGWFNTPEEQELRDAQEEARKARAHARQTIEDSRKNMHWMELALIPLRQGPPDYRRKSTGAEADS